MLKKCCILSEAKATRLFIPLNTKAKFFQTWILHRALGNVRCCTTKKLTCVTFFPARTPKCCSPKLQKVPLTWGKMISLWTLQGAATRLHSWAFGRLWAEMCWGIMSGREGVHKEMGGADLSTAISRQDHFSWENPGNIPLWTPVVFLHYSECSGATRDGITRRWLKAAMPHRGSCELPVVPLTATPPCQDVLTALLGLV